MPRPDRLIDICDFISKVVANTTTDLNLDTANVDALTTWMCRLVSASLHNRIMCGTATDNEVQQYAEFIYGSFSCSELIPVWFVAKCCMAAGITGAPRVTLTAKQTTVWNLIAKAAALN